MNGMDSLDRDAGIYKGGSMVIVTVVEFAVKELMIEGGIVKQTREIVSVGGEYDQEKENIIKKALNEI